MNELEKLEKRKKRTRHILITVSVLFLFLMLVLPLLCIIASSLKEGFAFYMQSIRTDYVKSALKVTLIATVAAVVINTFFGLCVSWLLTKFSFRGKQVLATLIDIPFSISPVIVGLAFLMTFGRLGWTYPFIRAINQFFGTNIRIAFAIPGVILATVFVTFPYVSREVIPVLNAQGKDEEEAAALMGAGGLKIFFKITFPQMKWALLYGVILCTSRALGEFGAVKDKRRDLYTSAGNRCIIYVGYRAVRYCSICSILAFGYSGSYYIIPSKYSGISGKNKKGEPLICMLK